MPRVYPRKPVTERFMSKVRQESAEGCWLWVASCFAAGYGQFGIDGKNWQAHRLSWTLFRGGIPDGICVCHHCDNPPCVNPAHLWLGTNADNTADRNRKGRAARNRGEAAGGVKLTDTIVLEVRRRVREGETQADVHRSMGLTRQQVSRIILRQRWFNLPSHPDDVAGPDAVGKQPNRRRGPKGQYQGYGCERPALNDDTGI